MLWANSPICIDSARDYIILDQFFKMTVSSEDYGYVLEGSKPISIRNWGSPCNFCITKDIERSLKEFKETLLIREAIVVWNKACARQKNFFLKSVALDDPKTPIPALELLFINIPKLREVVNENIDIFRLVLGPTITPKQIVEKIVDSNEPLLDILQHNLTLVGIVLGFGSHNSLVGGRIETIMSLSISKDQAPFIPKSWLMQRGGDHSANFLTPESYGSYYLAVAGGDDTNFRTEYLKLTPNPGFANLEEEILALDALYEPLPSCLWETPKFVFGAYRGGTPNQPFFAHLVGTQKKIRSLLKKPDFLERVLKTIGGKKPKIRVRKSALIPLPPIFSHLNMESWQQILRQVTDRFEGNVRKLAFIDGFCHPTSASRQPPIMIGASAAAFEGLKKALDNLKTAENWLEALHQNSLDASLEMIVAKQLYFKTTWSGSGQKLVGGGRIRASYIIEDLKGNILFADSDRWLHLGEIIPGFAHGVQGMHVGEKRTLFVHPALAYGALTTLPPCVGLVIKVDLQDIDLQTFTNLSSLAPLVAQDLSWVGDDSFYHSMEESLEQQPRFIGSFYRDLLDEMQSLDKTTLIAELKSLY